MSNRSLQASPTGQKKARTALALRRWTQSYLASEIGLLTRQPIWKFLSGKKVDRAVFMDICFKLDLDWQDIYDATADQESDLLSLEKNSDIDVLVQKVRRDRYDKIKAQCGTIRLLDLSQPIELNDIYINVNILESPSHQRWLDIDALDRVNREEFNRYGLGKILQSQVPVFQAVQNYLKLMVLGKPGSGKTTLLQKIAIQCNEGELQPDLIPIFIRLKNFTTSFDGQSASNISQFIRQELEKSNISYQEVDFLLNQGKMLILLDGLDEVPVQKSYEILKEINLLSEGDYKNKIIITCRIAASQHQLEGFTEIELADLDFAQIAALSTKWFVGVEQNYQTALAKSKQFIEKLQLPENAPIRELAVTPILLNLTCSVFQAKGNLPVRRSDLYQQCLDVLLRRWDATRGIKRNSLEQELSLLQKIKLLSQIATLTFEEGRYFFEQQTLQQYIIQYLQTRPDFSQDTDELQLTSEAILNSIQLEHGIFVERAREVYSFSHLTFQEYLTAKSIVSNLENKQLSQNLNKLVSHIAEPRWREVFLLTAELLGNADELLQLMKQQIDRMLENDRQLQQFLYWLEEKSSSVKRPYQSAAIRAFYLSLTLARELNLAREINLAMTLDISLAGNLAPELNLDLGLERVLTLSLTLPPNPSLDRIVSLTLALPIESNYCDRIYVNGDDKRSQLCESLQQLKKQLPTLEKADVVKTWWNANSQAWIAELRTIMQRDRNIGQDWKFNDEQKKALRAYYQANQFLLDCVQSNCQVSPQVQSEIQETLFLPSRSLIMANNS